ncbi:unnamed protein product [Bursaphelenchus xylophilus]|uniref:(pine wood nematode) hypothetical protein n=1 Tax=Bursaphelenchus xylophilus TaxID=6326 RepID=A0A1I7RMR8_BURXY|nr:unnamed protein product [Bursaphelenchus xylophilus]CAG9125542.1 unnamed protein product [Bursaphelenchus xylophilus]
MSETSTNSSFSVLDAEEKLEELRVEFDSSSMVSEANTDLDKTIDEKASSSLDIDFSSVLTAQEKEDLQKYPEEIASFIWPVYQSCSTWSTKFGNKELFQQQINSHISSRAFTWTLHYGGQIEGYLANLRVRYVGKAGSCERRYEGDAMKKWVPNFNGEEKMFGDMEPIYIYVYARIQKCPPEVTPWIKEMVFGHNYYNFGDVTVKCKDGELKVSKSVLAEFFPRFRAFFVRYPEENQILIENFWLDGFKMAVEFMWTRKPFEWWTIGDEMMDLAEVLGAPAFMAEIDHQYTFWAKQSNFARNLLKASEIGLPVLKREMEKLTTLHWDEVFKENEEFIKENIDLFLNLKLGPIMTGY